MFYQVVDMAWYYLSPGTQQAIRQCSSTGRTLHDTRTTDLVVRLGHSKPDSIDAEDQFSSYWDVLDNGVVTRPAEPPTPAELRTALGAMVRRGAHFDRLRLRVLRSPDGHRPAHEREEQLLAVLEALSGSRLTTLAVSGGVPLSGRVAAALASAFPSMADVYLGFHWEENDMPPGGADSPEAAEYYRGAEQLLALCGPRLHSLQLVSSVQQWPPSAFRALSHCTALAHLQLEAGRRDAEGRPPVPPYLASHAHEEAILSSIVQLTTLRSLWLSAFLDPDTCTPQALAPHATSVARLSALTGLTSLHLDLTLRYEHDTDSWRQRRLDGDDYEAWAEVREAHRTSLLSALHAMPQLEHLHCPTLWLHPEELVPLTALASLYVAGLYTPPPGGGDSSRSASGGGGGGGTVPLPARLVDLTLDTAVSPRLLASLQVPSTLVALHVWRMRFGMHDINPATGQLLPETVAAVGPAIKLVADLRSESPCSVNLVLQADGCPGLLLPREGLPDRHAEWLSQLGPLGGLEDLPLGLDAFDLDVEDVCCLVHAVGSVPRLQFLNTALPVPAIPVLLGLRELQELDLDMHRCSLVFPRALRTALSVLCGQARKLRRVTCCRCPLTDCQAVQEAVVARLHGMGRDGVELVVTSDDV